MTDDELLDIINRGAARLAEIPKQQQEHALAQLRAVTEKIARDAGYSRDDGLTFAEELIAALRVVGELKASFHSRSLH